MAEAQILTEGEFLVRVSNHAIFRFKENHGQEMQSNMCDFLHFMVSRLLQFTHFQDIRCNFPHIIFQYVFIALDYLKLYETCSVMAR